MRETGSKTNWQRLDLNQRPKTSRAFVLSKCWPGIGLLFEVT